MMNRQAQAWGLKNTVFKNVTGLTEPGHHSTARDLAVIASRIISDFPEYYPIYSTRKYRFEGAPASNENNRNVLLLRDPTVDGMKTGYTEAAGYCLIASAQRDFPNGKRRRLLSVVLGTASMEARANESQKLLNWGFHRLRRGAPVRGRQGRSPRRRSGRARPTRPSSAPRGGVFVTRAQGRGRQAADQDRAHRPAGRAAGQGPDGGHAEGQHARRARRWPRCRWWCWRRSSRPASSAAPGTPSACGSSKLNA